jgi:hypothetical protein
MGELGFNQELAEVGAVAKLWCCNAGQDSASAPRRCLNQGLAEVGGTTEEGGYHNRQRRQHRSAGGQNSAPHFSNVTMLWNMENQFGILEERYKIFTF